MKSILYIIIFAILPSAEIYLQNFDTIQIKKQIDVLVGANAIQTYLHEILAEDQIFRGNKTNDSLDILHLISISYFINKFGYPDKKEYGDDARAPWVIWVHNHRRLCILSFPIILKGFLSGQIREADLREYYLRTIYTYQFDDEDYLKMPLKELFEKLKLNTSKTILIDQLLNEAAEIQVFKNKPREVIGRWKSEGTSKIYEVQGEKLNMKFEGERVEIIKLQSGETFFCKLSSDGSIEPRELYLAKENEYRFKHLKTDNFLSVSAEKLIIRNCTSILKEYKKLQ